jgi:hypothetical protein
MSHYTLFVPQTFDTEPLTHLQRLGLDSLHVAGDPAPTTALASLGPTGGPGLMISWSRIDSTGSIPCFYDAANQIWQPLQVDHARQLPAGRAWLGWHKEQIPEPADLERKVQHGTGPLQLGLHQWIIPCLLDLPHRMRLEEGHLKHSPCADFLWFSERAEWGLDLAARWVIGDELSQHDLAEAYRFAARMLGLNYRINLEIALALDLLTDHTVRQMLMVAWDYPRFQTVLQTLLTSRHEEAKKKSAGTNAT